MSKTKNVKQQEPEVAEVQEQVVAEAQAAEEYLTDTDYAREKLTAELMRGELRALVRFYAESWLFRAQPPDVCNDCWRSGQLMAGERLGYFATLLGSDAVMEILDDEHESASEDPEEEDEIPVS